MAKTETLVDTFDDNSLNAQWTTSVDAGAVITEVGGVVQIAITAATAYGSVISAANYDLTDSFAGSRLVDPGGQATMDLDVSPIIIKNSANADYFGFIINANTLLCHTFLGGVDANLDSRPFVLAQHRCFRVLEIAGTTYFVTSRDGKGYEVITSTPTASLFDVSSVTPMLQAGIWGVANTTTVKFDDFNFSGRVYMPTNKLRPGMFQPGIAR